MSSPDSSLSESTISHESSDDVVENSADSSVESGSLSPQEDTPAASHTRCEDNVCGNKQVPRSENEYLCQESPDSPVLPHVEDREANICCYEFETLFAPAAFRDNVQLDLNLKSTLHRWLTYHTSWFPPALKLDLANSGFFFIAGKHGVQCYFCKIFFRYGFKTCNIQEKHKKFNPGCPLMKNAENTTNIPMPVTDYRYEAFRLLSYVSSEWSSSVKTFELAKLGFYRTPDDSSVCAFCKLEVKTWGRFDSVASKHLKESPDCVFLRDDFVGNIPIGQELAEMTSDADKEEASAAVLHSPTTRSKQSKNGHNADTVTPSVLVENLELTACHKDYITLEKRIMSFEEWPDTNTQNPLELAEAGFFFLGHRDEVCCFQCGGCLKNWLPTDKPWHKHAVQLPDCPYILFKKGTIAKNLYTLLSTKAVKKALKKFEAKTKKRTMKTLNTNGSLSVCLVCRVKPRETVNLPCSCTVACEECVVKESICLKCNKPRNAFKLLNGH